MLSETNILQSYQEALVPGTNLVDGRSETDLLSLVVDYASLINFYDKDNQINGNWQPFLLKDPVFLSAHIKSFQSEQLYSLYKISCIALSNFLDKMVIPTEEEAQDISSNLKDVLEKVSLNISRTESSDQGEDAVGDQILQEVSQLLDQLIYVFTSLEKWTQFMQQCNTNYTLKSYIFDQLKTSYGGVFWAILSWKDALSVKTIGFSNKIEPVEWDLYADYDQKLWKDSRGKEPFWDILQLSNPEFYSGDPSSDSDDPEKGDIVDDFKNVGKTVFDFLNQITSYAMVSYEENALKESKYPDTTLMRSFVNLMGIYQDQWNSLSEKHLKFYYQDILKQSPKDASPDSTLISIKLSSTDSSYKLPSGTLFNAGENTDGSTITFQTNEDALLYPTEILNTYTLSVSSETPSTLNLEQLKDVGKVKKDEDGSVQKWKTFGTSAHSSVLTSMSTVMASPLLYLGQSDSRTVTLTISLEASSKLSAFQNAKYYLSTKEAWLQTTPTFPSITSGTEDPIGTSIEVEMCPAVTDPIIEAFTKNPDGISSEWPMLKIEFNSFDDVANPPVITQIEIDVTVSGMKDFTLFNDFGALDSKKPFQPLGPTVEKNQNFFVGSSEIFSKPIVEFNFSLTWDKLPEQTLKTTVESEDGQSEEEETLYGFDAYYLQYNNWFKGVYSSNPPCIESTTAVGNIVKGLLNVAGEIVKHTVTPITNGVKSLFTKSKDSEKTNEETNETNDDAFSNTGFTVTFQQMDNGTWSSFSENSDSDTTLYKEDDDAKSHIAGSSSFSFGDASGTDIINSAVTPTLQLAPLTFSDDTNNGFVRLQLTSDYGFGTSVYPQLVNSVALYNAAILTYSVKHPGKCTPVTVPNLPYIPTAGSMTGGYTAKETYSFKDKKDPDNAALDSYPLEMFYYTPFGKYKVFDTSAPFANDEVYLYDGFHVASPFDKNNFNGLPLWSAFEATGQLFLEISDPLAPSQLRLYFELNRSFSNVDTEGDTTYYGLTTDGWVELSVLSDSTQELTCSGVVTLSLPESMTSAPETFPNGNFWVSVSTSADVDAYAQTTFLDTNGCAVTRSSTDFLKDETTPQILADVITAPLTAIPEISAIAQPFSSFDGKPAESQQEMNNRVSTRLRTKERCVNNQDYFTVIQQEFTDIYYSKLIYDATTKEDTIYVVKTVESPTASNAYLPLVSKCQELKITDFLESKVSPFTSLKVKNFTPLYVQVFGTVTVDPTDAVDGVSKEINEAIQVFLSPWISANQTQIDIYNGLQASQIATFVKTFESVLEVADITIETNITEADLPIKSPAPEGTVETYNQESGYILIPCSQIAIHYQWPPS